VTWQFNLDPRPAAIVFLALAAAVYIVTHA
jgi:hypothetical protein